MEDKRDHAVHVALPEVHTLGRDPVRLYHTSAHQAMVRVDHKEREVGRQVAMEAAAAAVVVM